MAPRPSSKSSKLPAKSPARARPTSQDLPTLPPGVRFTKGTYPKKYTAHIPATSTSPARKVSFGHQDYQQYRDRVPVSRGGGLWSSKDHLDPRRRDRYHTRHEAQGYYKRPLSAAWFSYYFLW